MSQTSQQDRNRNTEQARSHATGDMSVRELVQKGRQAELRGGRKH